MPMNNVIDSYVFRPIDGVWRDVKGNGEILADVLQFYDLLVDDKCQFARFYDYDNNRCIWLRAYGSQKIELTIYKLQEV